MVNTLKDIRQYRRVCVMLLIGAAKQCRPKTRKTLAGVSIRSYQTKLGLSSITTARWSRQFDRGGSGMQFKPARYVLNQGTFPYIRVPSTWNCHLTMTAASSLGRRRHQHHLVTHHHSPPPHLHNQSPRKNGIYRGRTPRVTPNRSPTLWPGETQPYIITRQEYNSFISEGYWWTRLIIN